MKHLIKYQLAKFLAKVDRTGAPKKHDGGEPSAAEQHDRQLPRAKYHRANRPTIFAANAVLPEDPPGKASRRDDLAAARERCCASGQEPRDQFGPAARMPCLALSRAGRSLLAAASRARLSTKLTCRHPACRSVARLLAAFGTGAAEPNDLIASDLVYLHLVGETY